MPRATVQSETVTVMDKNSCAGGEIRIPANVVQREDLVQGDTVHVTLYEPLPSLDSLSFTTDVIGGERVTVPSQLVRRVDLPLAAEYDVSFAFVADQHGNEPVHTDCDDDEDEDEPSEIDELLDDGESFTDEDAEPLFPR